MRTLMILLVGGIFLLSACTGGTPGTIPETGPGAGTAEGTLPPGGDFTVVPPTEDGGDGVTGEVEVTGTPQEEVQTPGATATEQEDMATPGASDDDGEDDTEGDSNIPPDDPQPTIGPDVDDGSLASLTYPFLVQELSEEGAVIEDVGEVEEPVFGARGRLIQVNGADVTVFEFTNETSRRQAWDALLAAGGELESITPSEAGMANFYASGQVVILYVGDDPLVRDQLGSVLEHTYQPGGAVSSELPEDIAAQVQQRLSELLGVPITGIRIVEVSAQNWPDSCLGLGQPNESCAAVVTPGYSLTVEAGGQRYNVRASQDASAVRWTQVQ